MSELLPPSEILSKLLITNKAKSKRKLLPLIILAILAGSFIGLAAMFYLVASTGTSEVAFGHRKIVAALAFSTGLGIVVIAGCELFTSNTLMAISSINGDISWRSVFKNWLLVYIFNFVGSVFLVVLMYLAKVHLQDGGGVGIEVMYVAKGKLSRTFIQAIVLGILCNFVVCLSYWITLASSTAVGKTISLTLPIMAFVAIGFEHSVANMFFLPFAMILKHDATFLNTVAGKIGDLSYISYHNIIFANLIPVTIGNIIGGAFMLGVPYYLAYKNDIK